SGTPEFGSDVLVASAKFDPTGIISKPHQVFMDRVSQMAVVAAHHALENSGLLSDGTDLSSTAVYTGCALGGSQTMENAYKRYFKKIRGARPTTVPLVMPNAPAGHISMRHKLRGPSQNYSIACASSSTAIGEAFRAIRDGYQERVVTGGTEAMLNDGSICSWEALTVLAKEHPEGAHASCRPFSKDRTGLVLGEGASILILESEAMVEKRNAQPLAEIVGFGSSSDAHNLTQPSAEGQVRAMRIALNDAEIDLTEIGYINAHATGTGAGDKVEIDAIKLLFEDHAKNIAVSSTKSMHGHLLGAAGALEFAITVMALKNRQIPPTAHLKDQDPECDLDCVPFIGRSSPELNYALCNSFAFGGSNAVLIARHI
ncbi:MAG: beta-ketoacyl-[acyl-carrier-protein] synthase family protein, partial [Nitrosomonadaceae bacterium]|nr:beta-ketoacyl-[acyl-carrier-protein] synthase family protein [Nitrosomonadaceae bacterium]